MTMSEAAYRKVRKKIKKRPKEFDKSVKMAVLKERRVYGTSQRELAAGYGVSQSTVCQWLKAARAR